MAKLKIQKNKHRTQPAKSGGMSHETVPGRLAVFLHKGILGCIILMVIGVPLAFYSGSLERYPIPKTTVLKVLAITALTLWAFRVISEKKFIFKKTSLDLPIVLYLAVSFLSFKNASNIHAFENSFVNMVIFVSLYYLVLNNVKREWIGKILFFSGVTAIAASFFGIYQYATATQFNLNTTVISTLGHSNFLAQYLIAIIPVSLAFFLKSSKIENTLLWGVGSLVIFSCLILTFSRGGWLGFAVSMGFFILLYRLSSRDEKLKGLSPRILKRRLVLFLIFVLFLSGLLISSKTYILQSILINPKNPIPSTNPDKNIEFNYKILTALLRVEMWKGTLEMIKESPVFGVGLGNYPIQSPRFRTWEELSINQDILWWAHNDYLQMTAESGILALSSFLLLLCIFFKTAIKEIKYIEKDSKIFFIGLVSSILATLTHSFFSFNLYQPVPTMLFWLFIALAMISQKGKEFELFHFKTPQKLSQWHPRLNFPLPFQIISGLIVFSLFVIGSIATIKPFLADIYYTKGEINSMNAQWEESIPFYQEANKLSPFNPKYRYALAVSLYKVGDFKESIAEGEVAYKLTPFISDVNRILCLAKNEIGNKYVSQGKLDLAITKYNEVIKLINERRRVKLRASEINIWGRELANALYNRGNIFFMEKSYKEALNDYQETLKLAPDHYYAIQAIEKIRSIKPAY